MLLLWCTDWVGSLYAIRIFMYFCIKGSIRTQDEVGRLCFKPPGVLLYWPFWGGGPSVNLTLCFFVVCSCVSVLLALQLPRLGERDLILVLFVHLFYLRFFFFVLSVSSSSWCLGKAAFCFHFLLVSGKGCGLWMWHSLDFSLTFFNSSETFRFHPLTICIVILSTNCVCGGVYCFHVARPFVTFWFLLLNLLNNLGNLFVFCINVVIDEVLLLDKNKGLGVNSFRVIPRVILEKAIFVSASYLAK